MEKRMISKIEARNYRSLRNISQGLDRFHVLAGPNGSGKSTFLEVVRVLGAFAGEGLERVWEESRTRQFPELMFGGQGGRFQLAVEVELPAALMVSLKRKEPDVKRVARYEVEIGMRGGMPEISDRWKQPTILAENLWIFDPGRGNGHCKRRPAPAVKELARRVSARSTFRGGRSELKHHGKGFDRGCS